MPTFEATEKAPRHAARLRADQLAKDARVPRFLCDHRVPWVSVCRT